LPSSRAQVVDKMKQKIEVLKRCCDTTERAFEDIELATYYMPAAIPGAENSLDAYAAAVSHTSSV
jgi:hypothetical protein